ncbi:sdr42e1 [Scenedesmus sp. PABB004]|nr:sdr42e1 [Scenedesmus sp. PABB004]
MRDAAAPCTATPAAARPGGAHAGGTPPPTTPGTPHECASMVHAVEEAMKAAGEATPDSRGAAAAPLPNLHAWLEASGVALPTPAAKDIAALAAAAADSKRLRRQLDALREAELELAAHEAEENAITYAMLVTQQQRTSTSAARARPAPPPPPPPAAPAHTDAGPPACAAPRRRPQEEENLSLAADNARMQEQIAELEALRAAPGGGDGPWTDGVQARAVIALQRADDTRRLSGVYEEQHLAAFRQLGEAQEQLSAVKAARPDAGDAERAVEAQRLAAAEAGVAAAAEAARTATEKLEVVLQEKGRVQSELAAIRQQLEAAPAAGARHAELCARLVDAHAALQEEKAAQQRLTGSLLEHAGRLSHRYGLLSDDYGALRDRYRRLAGDNEALASALREAHEALYELQATVQATPPAKRREARALLARVADAEQAVQSLAQEKRQLAQRLEQAQAFIAALQQRGRADGATPAGAQDTPALAPGGDAATPGPTPAAGAPAAPEPAASFVTPVKGCSRSGLPATPGSGASAAGPGGCAAAAATAGAALEPVSPILAAAAAALSTCAGQQAAQQIQLRAASSELQHVQAEQRGLREEISRAKSALADIAGQLRVSLGGAAAPPGARSASASASRGAHALGSAGRLGTGSSILQQPGGSGSRGSSSRGSGRASPVAGSAGSAGGSCPPRARPTSAPAGGAAAKAAAAAHAEFTFPCLGAGGAEEQERPPAMAASPGESAGGAGGAEPPAFGGGAAAGAAPTAEPGAAAAAGSASRGSSRSRETYSLDQLIADAESVSLEYGMSPAQQHAGSQAEDTAGTGTPAAAAAADDDGGAASAGSAAGSCAAPATGETPNAGRAWLSEQEARMRERLAEALADTPGSAASSAGGAPHRQQPALQAGAGGGATRSSFAPLRATADVQSAVRPGAAGAAQVSPLPLQLAGTPVGAEGGASNWVQPSGAIGGDSPPPHAGAGAAPGQCRSLLTPSFATPTLVAHQKALAAAAAGLAALVSPATADDATSRESKARPEEGDAAGGWAPPADTVTPPALRSAPPAGASDEGEGAAELAATAAALLASLGPAGVLSPGEVLPPEALRQMTPEWMRELRSRCAAGTLQVQQLRRQLGLATPEAPSPCGDAQPAAAAGEPAAAADEGAARARSPAGAPSAGRAASLSAASSCGGIDRLRRRAIAQAAASASAAAGEGPAATGLQPAAAGAAGEGSPELGAALAALGGHDGGLERSDSDGSLASYMRAGQGGTPRSVSGVLASLPPRPDCPTPGSACSEAGSGRGSPDVALLAGLGNSRAAARQLAEQLARHLDRSASLPAAASQQAPTGGADAEAAAPPATPGGAPGGGAGQEPGGSPVTPGAALNAGAESVLLSPSVAPDELFDGGEDELFDDGGEDEAAADGGQARQRAAPVAASPRGHQLSDVPAGTVTCSSTALGGGGGGASDGVSCDGTQSGSAADPSLSSWAAAAGSAATAAAGGAPAASCGASSAAGPRGAAPGGGQARAISLGDSPTSARPTPGGAASAAAGAAAGGSRAASGSATPSSCATSAAAPHVALGDSPASCAGAEGGAAAGAPPPPQQQPAAPAASGGSSQWRTPEGTFASPGGSGAAGSSAFFTGLQHTAARGGDAAEAASGGVAFAGFDAPPPAAEAAGEQQADLLQQLLASPACSSPARSPAAAVAATSGGAGRPAPQAAAAAAAAAVPEASPPAALRSAGVRLVSPTLSDLGFIDAPTAADYDTTAQLAAAAAASASGLTSFEQRLALLASDEDDEEGPAAAVVRGGGGGGGAATPPLPAHLASVATQTTPGLAAPAAQGGRRVLLESGRDATPAHAAPEAKAPAPLRCDVLQSPVKSRPAGAGERASLEAAAHELAGSLRIREADVLRACTEADEQLHTPDGGGQRRLMKEGLAAPEPAALELTPAAAEPASAAAEPAVAPPAAAEAPAAPGHPAGEELAVAPELPVVEQAAAVPAPVAERLPTEPAAAPERPAAEQPPAGQAAVAERQPSGLAAPHAAAVAEQVSAPSSAAARPPAQQPRAGKEAPPPPMPPAPPRAPRGPRQFGRPPRPPRPPAPRPPSPPPPPPPPPAADRVQPRLDVAIISALDDDNLYRMLYLMALDEFMTSGPVTGDDSYHGVAGIHGALSPYNGQSPPGAGFCRHNSEAFGPWHRPYCRLFERNLQAACRTVAGRFAAPERRAAALYTCGMLRAPYWDAAAAPLPGLLIDETVTVLTPDGAALTTARNPLRGYCFRAPAATGRGSKSVGDCVSRDFGWDSGVSSQAAAFGGQVSAFLSSWSWSCTNLGGRGGCAGNLELCGARARRGFHNNVHNSVGGDMATLSLAGWDPLFWLHHVNVDRLLFLFQSSSAQYLGTSWYAPFGSADACGEVVADCGYAYGAGGPAVAGRHSLDNIPRLPPLGGGRRGAGAGAGASAATGAARRLRSADAAAATAAAALDDGTASGDPGSPAARAYLARYVSALTGGYAGYSWSAVISRLNPAALRDRKYALHVLLASPRTAPGARALPAQPGGGVDVNALRGWPEYCGSNAGFNTYNPEGHTMDRNTTVAIYLNPCLAAMGRDPDVPPRVPGDATSGPAAPPLRPDELTLVCIDGDRADCTDLLPPGHELALGWSVLAPRFDATAQSFALGGDDGAGAGVGVADYAGGYAPHAAHAVPRGVPGDDAAPRFLYAQRLPRRPGPRGRRAMPSEEVAVITGGCGFVGRSLSARLLADGLASKVVLFDVAGPAAPLLPGEVHERGATQAPGAVAACLARHAPVGALFHVAAHGMSGAASLDAARTWAVNVEGTRAVIDACVACSVPRLLFTSTCNVVFGGQRIEGSTEASLPYFPPQRQVDAYSSTKTLAEMAVLSANGTPLPAGGALRTCALRPNGIYGAGETQHSMRLVRLAQAGGLVARFGDPAAVQDWTHIGNLVDAQVLAAAALRAPGGGAAAGQAYFIVDPSPTSSQDLLRPLLEGLGYSMPSLTLPYWLMYFLAWCMELAHTRLPAPLRPGVLLLTRSEVRKAGVTHWFSCDKARRDLGYNPQPHSAAEYLPWPRRPLLLLPADARRAWRSDTALMDLLAGYGSGSESDSEEGAPPSAAQQHQQRAAAPPAAAPPAQRLPNPFADDEPAAGGARAGGPSPPGKRPFKAVVGHSLPAGAAASKAAKPGPAAKPGGGRARGGFVPPQLAGRSNVVTEDLDKLFTRGPGAAAGRAGPGAAASGAEQE